MCPVHILWQACGLLGVLLMLLVGSISSAPKSQMDRAILQLVP